MMMLICGKEFRIYSFENFLVQQSMGCGKIESHPSTNEKKNLNLIPRNKNNSLTAVFFVCFPMIGSNVKRTCEEFSNQRIASITNDAPRLENRTITIFPVPLRVTRIYSRTECKTRAITSTNTTVQFLASWQKKRRRLPIPLNEGTIYHSGVL